MNGNPYEAYYDGAMELCELDRDMWRRAYQYGGHDYEQRMKKWEAELLRHRELGSRALRGDEAAILQILKELGV